MLNQSDIIQTLEMIDHQHLDVRTITMGISLLSCADADAKTACTKIYDKITRYAEKLVATGEAIEQEFGIPIVNKRISVTPMALVAAASETEDYVPFAAAMDAAAKTCGVNFIGGFSALVQKGFTEADRKLIAAIPEALATTDMVCSSVNVGSTKAGINMDAVAEMGRIIKKTAELTADRGGFGCAKLVVFCNAVEDNPFMAGAFHGVGEPEKVFYIVAFPALVWQIMHQGESDAHALVMTFFTILYMIRDTWVTFMRSVGTLYGADVAAMWLGKVRTALSFPGAGWVYMYLAFAPMLPDTEGGAVLRGYWLQSCFWVEGLLIVLTVWSLFTYTSAYWPYLRQALERK